MAAHFAVSPQEDDVIIKQRLLTRTSVTRGEPPLKKLLRRFMALSAEAEKAGENTAEVEKLGRSFLQELQNFEQPLLKAKAVVEANKREQQNFVKMQEGLDWQIQQAQQDIVSLKQRLDTAKTERRHAEECESIRRLVATLPPRSQTEEEMARLEAELRQLEQEEADSRQTLELRKKQFALLLHTIEDLEFDLLDEGKNEKGGTIVAVLQEEPGVAEGNDPMAVDS